MRNKIKQMMNKEEGFTLVELLGVIVVLGIILAISVPAIGRIIENTRERADEAEIELIIDAARLYEVGEDVELTESSGVTVSELESAGYIEERGDGELPAGIVTRNSSGQLVFSETVPSP